MPDFAGLVVIVATAGAIAAGSTALSHPRMALAILFLLTSLSRATLATPLGTMRQEMPVVAVVALALLAGGRFKVLLKLPRSTVAIAIAFGIYLAALAFSLAFVAPDRAQSLRMVAWLAISMVGGVVAFVLMQPRPTTSMEPLAFAGAFGGSAGIVVAVGFPVSGPGYDSSVQDSNAFLGKSAIRSASRGHRQATGSRLPSSDLWSVYSSPTR